MSLNHIFCELKLRAFWLIVCYSLTCFSCYFFSEDLLFLLAKSFIILPKNRFTSHKSFISTHLTETLNTYFTSSLIISFVFCMPYVIYQMWCFYIPSCNQTQRVRISQFCVHSALAFLCTFSLSIIFILPQIWCFLYSLSVTSSKIFIIQLQPKIYDFIMLSIRFLAILSVCSQIPVILLCLIEYKIIALRECTKYRSTVWFCCALFAALLTPPDIWCQLSTFSIICMLIELTFVYALLRLHYDEQSTFLRFASPPL